MSTLDWELVHARLQMARDRMERGWAPTVAEKRQIFADRAVAAGRGGDNSAHGRHLDIVEFSIAQERYGIELAKVREVIPLKQLTPLPFGPSYLLGMVNARGRILSVVDLKRFFDLPNPNVSDQNKLLVLAGEEADLGIFADTVAGLRRVPEASLQPALPTMTGERAEYLLGIAPERVALLDATRIMADLTAKVERLRPRLAGGRKEKS